MAEEGESCYIRAQQRHTYRFFLNAAVKIGKMTRRKVILREENLLMLNAPARGVHALFDSIAISTGDRVSQVIISSHIFSMNDLVLKFTLQRAVLICTGHSSSIEIRECIIQIRPFSYRV